MGVGIVSRVFDKLTGLPGDLADEVKDAVFAVRKIPRLVTELHKMVDALNEAIRILEDKRDDKE